MSRGTLYGGQAVIEGVMIRGPRAVAVACRRSDGTIVHRTKVIGGRFSTGVRRIPLLRGIVVIWETIVVGMWALMYSSNVQLDEEGEELGPWTAAITFLSVLGLVVAVFFAGPVVLAGLLESVIDPSWLIALVEGVVRLFILIAYLFIIGLMPDIRRVYAYHGAEHKSIHALEAGDSLDVASVQRHSVAHIRCGTSFLLTVVILSIVVFLALGTPDLWLRIVSRILLIPLIAAIAYEVIRLGGMLQGNRLVRAAMAPNLALQALTTREPDDGQVEVAVYALKRAMAGEEALADSR